VKNMDDETGGPDVDLDVRDPKEINAHLKVTSLYRFVFRL